MNARTTLVAMAVASLAAASIAAAQVQQTGQQQTGQQQGQAQQQQQQQRSGVLAVIPLTTEAVATEIVGDTTLKGFAGKAKVSLSLVPASKEVCYDVTLADIPNVVDAKIFKGAKGENGTESVQLTLKTDTTFTKSCATVSDEVFTDISTNPTNYYIVINSKDHPMGVVRGQFIKPPQGD